MRNFLEMGGAQKAYTQEMICTQTPQVHTEDVMCLAWNETSEELYTGQVVLIQ